MAPGAPCGPGAPSAPAGPVSPCVPCAPVAPAGPRRAGRAGPRRSLRSRRWRRRRPGAPQAGARRPSQSGPHQRVVLVDVESSRRAVVRGLYRIDRHALWPVLARALRPAREPGGPAGPAGPPPPCRPAAPAAPAAPLSPLGPSRPRRAGRALNVPGEQRLTRTAFAPGAHDAQQSGALAPAGPDDRGSRVTGAVGRVGDPGHDGQAERKQERTSAARRPPRILKADPSRCDCRSWRCLHREREADGLSLAVRLVPD